MSISRLSTALENGVLSLPDTGPIAVFNPQLDSDLSPLEKTRLHVVQGFYPTLTSFKNKGYEASFAPKNRYAASVIYLPRAKAEARAMLAQAASVTDGPIVVDGQKTDGIMAMLNALKSRVEIAGTLSKSHGKLIWFTGGELSDWAATDTRVEGDFVTRPGVFSADGPDKGSRVLAAALPKVLKGRGVDLGAGWGYLSKAVLERESVDSLDLVEASHTALECAKHNIADPRAQFHWADARDWGKGEGVKFVISNPPFHTGRKGEPDLGRAFIRAAAAMLAPSGDFWMVANRHLPYEATLDSLFHHVIEKSGDAGFKVLHAVKPRRKPRIVP